MFKQQQIELDALSVISSKGSLTHKQILYHFIKIVSVIDANELFSNLYNGEYLELSNDQTTSDPDSVKYSISEVGKSHLLFLENEKRREELQDDLAWYEKQNAKDVFDNYPDIKKKSNFTFYLAIITAIVVIIELLLKLV